MCWCNKDKSHSVLDIRGMKIRKCSDISISVGCWEVGHYLFARRQSVSELLALSSLPPRLPVFLLLVSSYVLLMALSAFTWRKIPQLSIQFHPNLSRLSLLLCLLQPSLSLMHRTARLSWVAVYFVMLGYKRNVFLSLIGAVIMNTHTRRQAVKQPCENNARSPLILWKI